MLGSISRSLPDFWSLEINIVPENSQTFIRPPLFNSLHAASLFWSICEYTSLGVGLSVPVDFSREMCWGIDVTYIYFLWTCMVFISSALSNLFPSMQSCSLSFKAVFFLFTCPFVLPKMHIDLNFIGMLSFSFCSFLQMTLWTYW